MPSNPNGPLRRSQLIAPFGVGAMVVVPGGTSLIVGGLDFWYEPSGSSHTELDVAEFRIEEWRLQGLLGVSHFRLPPDYREVRRWDDERKNMRITIPAFRFPAWHFCPECKLLEERPLTNRGRIRCPECEALRRKTRFMYQVPFVALCERGHLQDFPWREWVHRSSAPLCQGTLRLVATGSATLAGQQVRCDGCKEERTLSGITNASEGSSLSKALAKDSEYLCPGRMPWLGGAVSQTCGSMVRGSLRSALNVYYAQIKSAIYLPRAVEPDLQEIEDLLQRPPVSTLAKTLVDLGAPDEDLGATLQAQYSKLLRSYSAARITQAVRLVFARDEPPDSHVPERNAPPLEDWHTAFRREEFNTLRAERHESLLKIHRAALDTYEEEAVWGFSRVMLVEKLRETRAFAGFTRVYPETAQTSDAIRQLLWRQPPTDPRGNWLPAYVVYGEGIYIELDEAILQEWENRPEVRGRCKPLLERYAAMQHNRRLRERPIGPRMILLHTLSHVLINRLTFECGYSSAALRERLYTSADASAPMAGVLIYTADGDSEGTMGGLVRMGKPGLLEPVIRRALESARWCSADPVCMEMGRSTGQGPDSCNLAACHNCTLVPETACEEFNRFLDRGLLVGYPEMPSLGYFDM